MPWVVQFSGQPDLLPRNARVLDSKSDLSLIAVSKSSIDVTVSFSEGNLNCLLDLVRLGLPCTKAQSWNLSSGVEGVGLSVEICL